MVGAVMSNAQTLVAIREFFGIVGYAGLILPSGWFGRPYDNLLQLSRSEASEGSLLIELDDQLLLTFDGQPVATSTNNGLRLGGFAVLHWDWTEFGSTVPHHEEFVAGEVEFVAAMT